MTRPRSTKCLSVTTNSATSPAGRHWRTRPETKPPTLRLQTLRRGTAARHKSRRPERPRRVALRRSDFVIRRRNRRPRAAPRQQPQRSISAKQHCVRVHVVAGRYKSSALKGRLHTSLHVHFRFPAYGRNARCPSHVPREHSNDPTTACSATDFFVARSTRATPHSKQP